MRHRAVSLFVLVVVIIGVGVLAVAEEPTLVPRVEPGQLTAPEFNIGKARGEPPADHRGDYLHRHGTAARANPERCASCHTENSCLRCHAGDAPPQKIHPPGFLAYHPIDAQNDPGSCGTCHAAETFCKDCHQLSRFTSSGGGQVAPGVGFHPASWLGGAPGPEHGRAARRDLTSCTSCHTEADCVQCHAGVNPHPPRWTGQCGKVMRANPKSCARCHTDMARLAGVCR